jgi:hypothetical protein
VKKSTKVKKGIIVQIDHQSLNQAVATAVLTIEQAPLTKCLRPDELLLSPIDIPAGLIEINGLKIVADPYLEPGWMILFCIHKTKRNGDKNASDLD